MLTVLKHNTSAVDFYTRKLGYTPDAISPSRCEQLDADHEILSKAVFPAGVALKEAIAEAFDGGRVPEELLVKEGALAQPPVPKPPAAATPAAAATTS